MPPPLPRLSAITIPDAELVDDEDMDFSATTRSAPPPPVRKISRFARRLATGLVLAVAGAAGFLLLVPAKGTQAPGARSEPTMAAWAVRDQRPVAPSNVETELGLAAASKHHSPETSGPKAAGSRSHAAPKRTIGNGSKKHTTKKPASAQKP